MENNLKRRYKIISGNLIIDDGVVEIRPNEFANITPPQGFTHFKSVIVPNSVKKIGYGAFRNTKIQDIILSDNVNCIESFAFCDCDAKSIHLGENIECVGDCAFYGNGDVTELKFPQDMRYCLSSIRPGEMFTAKEERDGEYIILKFERESNNPIGDKIMDDMDQEYELVQDDSSIHALSPLDGRYHDTTKDLKQFFSEHSYIQYRVAIEISYFMMLCSKNIGKLSEFTKENMRALADASAATPSHSIQVTKRIKKLEKKTGHDIKAIEYYIRELFDNIGISKFKSYIHFGLTSQDVDSVAYMLMLSSATHNVVIPSLSKLISKINELVLDYISSGVPMLSHTHGQIATPTTMAQQMGVFMERLERQLTWLKTYEYEAKFGGAVGNLNAHYVAHPDYDWDDIMDDFIKDLGLKRQHRTTQIMHYEVLSEYFDILVRINSILMDFCKDVWTYISMGYLTQKQKGVIGSSTMPHKINPIKFENAEGNLGMANAILSYMAQKLPISRLQRDLSDSTVMRNLGTVLGYCVLAYTNITDGLNDVNIDGDAIGKDLKQNPVVHMEAIQTIMRRDLFGDEYETIRKFVLSNPNPDMSEIINLIKDLDLEEKTKNDILHHLDFY